MREKESVGERCEGGEGGVEQSEGGEDGGDAQREGGEEGGGERGGGSVLQNVNRYADAGGSVWESNPPRTCLGPAIGFEVREAHQQPIHSPATCFCPVFQSSSANLCVPDSRLVTPRSQ